jgi:hypothetical protein
MRQLILSLIGFGLVGCAGNAPSNSGGDDMPEPDAAMPDAPETPVVGQKLSGKTMDYFTANTPMDLVTLASDGVTPPMSAMSATGGLYEINDVPTGSKIFFTLTRTNYRPTRNTAVTIAAADVVQDLYIATIADINRQYATAGKPVTAGKAFLAAELQTMTGTPLTGIAPTDVVLLDANNQPVTVAGTYFFGTNGDIDPALLTATAFGTPPRSRVAILDAPPGNYTLKVTYPNGQGGTLTNTTPVTFAADGATLALSGGGMPPGGTTITNPKFTTDIYPRLQKAAAGGLGCGNCHTLGGPAGGVLRFDLGAQPTLDAMKAITGVIDLTTPANSLLLTKPLYEPAPYNHPNATFVDINDPDYKLILLWIQQGALL